jgi:hypothetical protein
VGIAFCRTGYRIIDAEDVDEEESQQVFEEVKAASQELYVGECRAIVPKITISERIFDVSQLKISHVST